MSLFLLPRSFHVNSAGLPYGLAKLYHYRAGTLTTLSVYTDDTLLTPHSNPVVADANGIFPSIHVDPNSGFDLRVILKTSADVTIYDEDNLVITVAGKDNLQPFADAAKNIGSSTRRWQDLWLAGTVKIKSNSFKSTISNDTLTADRSIVLPDADFHLGATQVDTHNANYTLIISDIGKTLLHTDSSAYTYTIPTDASVAFPVGAVVEVDNTGSGTITVAASGGVSLYHANSAASGSISIYRYQTARLKKVAANTWLSYDKLSVVTGTFTGTLTGCTTSPTQTIAYSIIGDKVSLTVSGSLSATSNTTAMTITGLPAAIQTVASQAFPCAVIDNGVDRLGLASINAGTVTFYNSSATGALSATGFTNSGTKGIGAIFTLVYAI